MITNKIRLGIAIALSIGAGVYLIGCGESTHSDAPDPAPANILEGTHTQVIKMPDGFRNVVFTCYGTTGIYVTSRGGDLVNNNGGVYLPSAIAVLPNDIKCK